jgi:hypothetical protein
MLVTAGSPKRSSDQPAALREATARTRERHPISNQCVRGTVYIHMIWTLPSEDADFSTPPCALFYMILTENLDET